MRHRGKDQAGFSWEIVLGPAFVPHQFHRAAWLEFSLNLWDLIRQTRARVTRRHYKRLKEIILKSS